MGNFQYPSYILSFDDLTPGNKNVRPWRGKEHIGPSQLLGGVKRVDGMGDLVRDPEKEKKESK